MFKVSLIYNETNEIISMCDSLIEKVTERQNESFRAEDNLMGCIASEHDSKMNLNMTFYTMILSIFITLLSWKIDKTKR